MGGGGKKFNLKKKGINQGQLGKAIWNSSNKKYENSNKNKEHLLDVICDNYDEMNNKSIVEISTLDEYLSTSLRAQENFEEEKVIKIISNIEKNNLNRDFILKKDKLIQEKIINLPIPKRPMILIGPNCKVKNAPNMEYLENLEKEAFLNWRKLIAKEEEITGLFVTPFEKNLEFWKQLWRTIEKSHVVVEIIDSRDPLFFRNIDLEKYIHEIDPLKKIVLLFNKADFLSINIRNQWLKYFKLNAPNLNIYFFSALNEINKREKQEINQVSDDYSEEINEYDILTTQQLLYKLYILAKDVYNHSIQRYLNNNDKNFKKQINLSEKIHLENNNEIILDPLNPGEMTIGMVGFPNVGKSSIVNALFGSQKSSISKTPGKTKHLQTLKLKISNIYQNNDQNDTQSYIVLCDCPGLVMPSFTSTKEHLLINGAIPIDHFRGNFLDAIQLIGERIPKQLYQLYFNQIDHNNHKKFDSITFLNLLCKSRHLFQQGKGAIPDWSKAGRMILRDYWSGKLLYCHLPPNTTIDNNDNNILFNNSIINQNIIHSLDKLYINNDDTDTNDDSDIDLNMLRSSISKDKLIEAQNEQQKRKTKRQIRMDNKKLIKGKNICYS